MFVVSAWEGKKEFKTKPNDKSGEKDMRTRGEKRFTSKMTEGDQKGEGEKVHIGFDPLQPY